LILIHIAAGMQHVAITLAPFCLCYFQRAWFNINAHCVWFNAHSGFVRFSTFTSPLHVTHYSPNENSLVIQARSQKRCHGWGGGKFECHAKALEWRCRRRLRGGVWGGGILPVGWGLGWSLCPSPEIFLYFLLQNGAFSCILDSGAHFTPTVIVTMMFMTSTVKFLSWTCSTVQQKGRPRNFCADFFRGGRVGVESS